MGVGLSGGADSAMLAIALDHLARRRNVSLRLFHVHHGLLPQADGWADQVAALAKVLERPLDILRIDIASFEGKGMEAAARDARYHALAQAAAQQGVHTLWLAHHQDDQAETVLLRLLRGAGVAGMGAMRETSSRDGVRYLRPWLNVPRAAILTAMHDFTQATGWEPVHDPSNIDPRYTRAAVRTQLTPSLNARWPGWQAIVARHARQADEAASLLEEVAAADLATIRSGPDKSVVPGTVFDVAFDLLGWRALSAPRQRNLLRYWLSLFGARMPSDARLADLQRQLTQLHSLGHDRNLVFDHGPLRIRCVRGRVQAESRAKNGDLQHEGRKGLE